MNVSATQPVGPKVRRTVLCLSILLICGVGTALVVGVVNRSEVNKFGIAEQFEKSTPDAVIITLRLAPNGSILVGGTQWRWKHRVSGTNVTTGGNTRDVLEQNREGMTYLPGSLVVWECATGKVIRQHHLFDSDPNWVDVSDEGQVYAGAAHVTGQVAAWDAHDGRQIVYETGLDLCYKNNRPVACLSRDGRRLAVAMRLPVEDDESQIAHSQWADECEITVYDLTGGPTQSLIVDGLVEAMEFCHGHRRIATRTARASRNDPKRLIDSWRLEIFDLATSKRSSAHDLASCAYPFLRAVPGSTQLLVVNEDSVSVFDTATGEIVRDHHYPANDSGILSVRISRDGSRLTRCRGDGVDVTDLTAGAIDNYDSPSAAYYDIYDVDDSASVLIRAGHDNASAAVFR